MSKNCHIKLNNFIKGDLFKKMNYNILSNDKVNYREYDKIIPEILGELKLRFNWNPIATKYRVSEGKNWKTSNSTDAANFHRDINIFDGEKTPDIYTLVIYLDYATLDIIPQSCTTFNYNVSNYPQSIHFKPGDAILFNACNLHRGSFEHSYKTQSRKCIQLFEIYKNKKDYLKYKDKILTIPGGKNTNLEYLAQLWHNIPLLNKYIKYKGSKVFINKVPNDTYKYKYISTESQRPRAFKNIDNGNYYRMILKTHDSTDPNEDFSRYIKNPFIKSILKDIILLTVIISLILLFIKYESR